MNQSELISKLMIASRQIGKTYTTANQLICSKDIAKIIDQIDQERRIKERDEKINSLINE